MTSGKLFSMAIVLTFFSFQSCKKNESPAPVVPIAILQSGWSKKIIAIEGQLGDIFFNSTTTGYVLGSGEHKSTDGGNSWMPLSLTNVESFNIFMTADNKVFFAGQDPRIHRSVDGGVTFTAGQVASIVTDIFFTDNNNGYGVGPAHLFRTTDGGATWQTVATTGFPVGSLGNYSSLYFHDATTGWIVTEGRIFKTNASFENWQQATVDVSSPSSFCSVFAPSASVIYVGTTGGHIYKSINGGSSFTLIRVLGEGNYTDLHFINELVGYASAGRYIYKTTDGGVNWSKEVFLVNESIGELHFTDATHGWAVTSHGAVLIYRP